MKISFVGLLFLLLLNSFGVRSQSSYLYIEGIKGIPFNVISDNKEVKKLGKSYTLISYNEPGEKIIDITFINSNFAKQRFILDVQANSSYGFRMGKTDENKFYLIDLINEGKIIETNTAVNLSLSTPLNIIHVAQIQPVKVDSNIVETVTTPMEDEPRKVKKKKKKNDEVVTNESSQIVEVKNDTPAENKEIAVISENENTPKQKVKRRKSKSADSIVQAQPQNTEVSYGVVEVISPVKEVEVAKQSSEDEKKEIVPSAKRTKNNGCTKVASESEIASILAKMQEKEDDEAKLLLIKKKIVSGCFTADQVYTMAQRFDTQYGRYSLVKFVYPLTSDPSKLIDLDPLFKYETYKLKLKKLVE